MGVVMASKIKTNISSEVGKLEVVIIHQPGSEVENMTPINAERALYSDILNLTIAGKEYQQLKGVLDSVCKTFEVKDLLEEVLLDEKAKEALLKNICFNESVLESLDTISGYSAKKLATLLIEGVPLEKNNLTRYLSHKRFLLRPLHNLFFTRDSAMGMNNSMLIGRMANVVRERESIIMEAIFSHHGIFETNVVNPVDFSGGKIIDNTISFEGGDFQVARDDIFVIGTGIRTTTQGIDFILEKLKGEPSKKYHIIVQELPSSPESFIHLDMVFTFLSQHECMVYEPIIFELNRYRTIHITVEGGKVTSITEQPNILEALKKLGMDLKPISCGGKKDTWVMEREQWHSGANFFAIAPRKVIGYERNFNTLNELNKNGFEIIKAIDVIKRDRNIGDYHKCVISIAGSELARGGGGARCMTMPIKRAKVNW